MPPPPYGRVISERKMGVNEEARHVYTYLLNELLVIVAAAAV